MTEFCLPNTITPTKKPEYHQTTTTFSTLFLSGLYLLCSLLISHPLYFFYFIFFSPYLLKLLSFLSPLFITTALFFLLAFLTISPAGGSTTPSDDELSDSNSFMAVLFLRADIAVRSVLEKLRSRADDDEQHEESHLVRTVLDEEVEVYRIVFEVTEIPVREVLEDDCSQIERSSETLTCGSDETRLEIPWKSEELLQEKEIWCETVSYCTIEEEEEKVIEIAEQRQVKKPLIKSTSASNPKMSNNQMNESIARVNARAIEDVHYQKKLEIVTTSSTDENSLNQCTNLENSGSMRKEKEWKRTLACKLFEERHNNGDGTEGMDSLWETYETTESNKRQGKNRSKKGTKTKTKMKNVVKDDDVDDEGDGEDGEAAQLCCLQALKFSAGKMNLGMGMGRPGFVKISKALKGIGWLHHPGRHAKKTIV